MLWGTRQSVTMAKPQSVVQMLRLLKIRRHRRKRHPRFKKTIYNHPNYRKWRKAVFRRDNYTCQLCGRTDYIEAHHIRKKSTHPSLVFDVDNGITLCGPCTDKNSCHGKVTHHEKKYERMLLDIVKSKKGPK